MTEIHLMDTSVFIFFVDIPQEVKNQQRKKAAADGLNQRRASGAQVVLPIATIVETLQHIWRIEDGGIRRQCSETFHKLVTDAVNRTAPWTFIKSTWDESFVRALLAQGGPVRPLITSLGNRDHEAGDLLIMTELRSLRASYPAGQVQVHIWSFDNILGATADTI